MSGLTPEQIERLATALATITFTEDMWRGILTHDSRSPGPVVAALIAEAVEEALLTEADWFDTAHANSADKGYTVHQREGFGWAAGWIRLHARIARGEVTP